MRALVTALVTGALLVPATGAADEAAARSRVMPGSFTGYAFDTCDAPSQHAMNRWLKRSRYWGVGVYIAGMNRACSTQEHLTRRWVTKQSRHGWRVLPLVVGRQASCSPKGFYVGARISPKRRDDYAKAREQGRNAARGAVKAAHRLGIRRHSVLWFDLEHFDASRRKCRGSAMAFVSSWTRQLHRLHYRSGLYSSASSGILMVDRSRRRSGDDRALPDYLWVAEWNAEDRLHSSYITREGWWPHRRIHQFRGGHDERHGGVRLNIDTNYMSTGHGTRAGRAPRPCGTRVGLPSYPRLTKGDRGRAVRAAQCLLKARGSYSGRIKGHLDKRTMRAVVRFQRHHDLRVRRVLNRPTWTALLSSGGTPLLKYGSGGRAVRRLQRSLNAASRAGVRVDGVFSRGDLGQVRHYQRQTGLRPTGVVTDSFWRRLHAGRTVGKWRERRRHRTFAERLDRGLVTLPLPVPWNSGAPPRG